jgi:translocation and assembly module TamB
MARSRAQWWLAGVLGSIAGLVLAYFIATKTEFGRGWLLDTLLGRTAGLFGGRGKLRVGVLRHISPSHIIAEDVSLVDSTGAAVVHAKFLDGTLDVGGLYSKAIHIRTLHLRDVTMDFHQDFTGPFNIKYIRRARASATTFASTCLR